jgi:hypothetical protein
VTLHSDSFHMTRNCSQYRAFAPCTAQTGYIKIWLAFRNVSCFRPIETVKSQVTRMKQQTAAHCCYDDIHASSFSEPRVDETVLNQDVGAPVVIRSLQ